MAVLPLLSRVGVYGQCVQPALELRREQRIDLPMPGDTADAVERIRHQHHLEMGFGTGGHMVSAAFIGYVEVLQFEGVDEGRFDAFGAIHGRQDVTTVGRLYANEHQRDVVAASRCQRRLDQGLRQPFIVIVSGEQGRELAR